MSCQRPRTVGDYRVLYLGDPRLMPFPSTDLGDGVAMALVGDGRADLRDRWDVADQAADDELRGVIEQIAGATTQRAGRMLAPFGVRFIVVPLVDGVTSTTADPLPVPGGLLESLGGQLDLVRSITAASFARFENQAVIPTTAQLEGPLAEAAADDSIDRLVAVDTSGATPVLAGAEASGAAVGGGCRRGRALRHAARRGLAAACRRRGRRGTARLRRDDRVRRAAHRARRRWTTRTRRRGCGGWCCRGCCGRLALLAASRLSVPGRFRIARGRDETLIDLDAEPGADLPPPADKTGFGGDVRRRRASWSSHR